MALISAGKKKKVKLSEMNMTPLIDIVFQLLLFFMVGMKFKEIDRKLDTDLPKASKPKQDEHVDLKIELWISISVHPATRGTGEPLPLYKLDGATMRDKEDLRENLRRRARVAGVLNDPVILDPSDDAHHGWVMTAMDYLHELKFKSINFKQ